MFPRNYRQNPMIGAHFVVKLGLVPSLVYCVGNKKVDLLDPNFTNREYKSRFGEKTIFSNFPISTGQGRCLGQHYSKRRLCSIRIDLIDCFCLNP